MRVPSALALRCPSSQRAVGVRWRFAFVAPNARRRYLALYDMNRQTHDGRKAFLRRVEEAMAVL